jgi:hypothetical protein
MGMILCLLYIRGLQSRLQEYDSSYNVLRPPFCVEERKSEA